MSMFDFLILAQSDFGNGASALGAVIGLVFNLIFLAIGIVGVAGMWKTFVKMGLPGWACLVPIYNVIVMLEAVDRPTWWVLPALIPGVGAIIGFLIYQDIAEGFGKDTLFAVGMLFLYFIFFPLLGFGDAQWHEGKKKKAMAY